MNQINSPFLETLSTDEVNLPSKRITLPFHHHNSKWNFKVGIVVITVGILHLTPFTLCLFHSGCVLMITDNLLPIVFGNPCKNLHANTHFLFQNGTEILQSIATLPQTLPFTIIKAPNLGFPRLGASR